MEREALPVEVRDAKVLTCDQQVCSLFDLLSCANAWRAVKQALNHVLCVQAGDVLYVPQQWWHSTLCLQESIGLAQQLGGRRGFFQLQMNMQD